MQDALLITAVVLSGLAFATSAVTLGVVLYGGNKAQVTLEDTMVKVQAKSTAVVNETTQFIQHLAEVLSKE